MIWKKIFSVESHSNFRSVSLPDVVTADSAVVDILGAAETRPAQCTVGNLMTKYFWGFWILQKSIDPILMLPFPKNVVSTTGNKYLNDLDLHGFIIDQNSPRFSPCVPECTMDQRGSKCVLKDKKSKFFKYSQIFTKTLLHIWAFEMSKKFCTVVTQGQQQSFV